MIKGLPRDYMPRVVAARVCGPFSVLVVFDDGVSKVVDLSGRLKGPVYRPFRTPAGFAKLRVDHDAGTIVWSEEADIAPETLYLLPDARKSKAKTKRKTARPSRKPSRRRNSGKGSSSAA